MVCDWRANFAQNIFPVQLVFHSPLTPYIVKRSWLHLSTFEPLLPPEIGSLLLLPWRHRVEKTIWEWMVAAHIRSLYPSLTLASFLGISFWRHPFWTLISWMNVYIVVARSGYLNRFSHLIVKIWTYFSFVQRTSWRISILFRLKLNFIVLSSCRDIQLFLVFC